MISFNCSKCGQEINVADKHAGKKGKCPKCGNVVIVPEKSTVIEFHCESCGQKITVPEKYAGRQGSCPKCRKTVLVPGGKPVGAEGTKTVHFRCAMCDEAIEAPENSRGKLIECPHCSSYVEVPSEKPAEEKPEIPVEPVKEQVASQRRVEARPAPVKEAGEEKSPIPSHWHYVIGAVVVVAGVIAFVVFLVTQISTIIPKIQVVVPGTHEVQLPKPGKYTIFYEYQSVVDGKVYSTGQQLSGMRVMLRHKNDSRQIELSQPSMSGNYQAGGRAGMSVLEFELENPGTYILTADYSSGVTGSNVVLAIGQFKLLGTILGGLGIFFGSAATGGIVIGRAYMKRRKAVM